MAVIAKFPVDISLPDDLFAPPSKCAVRLAGVLGGALESLADTLGLNARVGIVQWFDHLSQNAEYLSRARRAGRLWTELLVDASPVDLALRKERIPYGEGPPEHVIIRCLSIGNLTARIGQCGHLL